MSEGREPLQRKPVESDGSGRSVSKKILYGVASVLLLAGVAWGGAVYAFAPKDAVYPGVSIAGIDMSGMSHSEVKSKVKDYLEEPITFTAGKDNYSYTLKETGVEAGLNATVDQAFKVGYGSNLFRVIEERIRLQKTGMDIPIIVNKDKDKWSAFVEKLKALSEHPAENAKLVMKDGEIDIVPEISGTVIDVAALESDFPASYAKGSNEVEVPLITDNPELTAAKYDEWKLTEELASFSTNYSSSSWNRKKNIKTAAGKITEKLLMPGEVFSFNGTVGRRTVEEGFQEAPVYKDGKVDKGIGGGICQVSTTLYNCALLSGMEIVERSNHSMLVHYVPPGRDATVDYGSKDLKFKNSYDTPVYIQMIADGSDLEARIYGKGDGRTFKVTSQRLSTIPFKVIAKTVKTKAEMGENQKGANGATAAAWRIVYKDGKEISRENLGTSVYKPMNKISYTLESSGQNAGNQDNAGNSSLPSDLEELPPTNTNDSEVPNPV